MKKIVFVISILFIAACSGNVTDEATPEAITQVQPLYSGTLFVSPDILDSSDPSFFVSLEKISDEQRRMFDRRNGMNESYGGGNG